MPLLNLLVIRAAELDRTAAFYEALGFQFSRERHGQGPEHLAAEANGFTLEIYPTACSVDTQAVRLGFQVDDVAATLEKLIAAGGTIVVKPRPTPTGRRAIIGDPDGRRVEITDAVIIVLS